MLKQLRVHHSGAFFRDWSDQTTENNDALGHVELEALWIGCDDATGSFVAPSKAAWHTCLRRLSALTITTCGPPSRHQASVRTALQQGYSVGRFVWNSISRSSTSNVDATYDENRTKTREWLAIPNGTNDKAQHPLSVRGRLAFASVLKRKAMESNPRAAHELRQRASYTGLGALSPDVARLICAFATTDVDRMLWVGDC